MAINKKEVGMDKKTQDTRAPANVDEKNTKAICRITAKDVRNHFCPDATNAEVELFLRVAKMNNLNPFKRELHLVKYGNHPAAVVTGYEAYLKRGLKTKDFRGYWVDTEGSAEKGDLTAKITIHRDGWEFPFTHTVKYSEYAQKVYDKQKRQWRVTKFWANMPETMIKKVAISQGFRLCFPDEFDGWPYAKEEMNFNEVIDVDFEEAKTDDVPRKKSEPGRVLPPTKITDTSPIRKRFEAAKKFLGQDFGAVLKSCGYKREADIPAEDAERVVIAMENTLNQWHGDTDEDQCQSGEAS